MKQIALLTAAMLVAGQANALSCLRPDPAQTFQRASDASEIYVVLRGSFDFDEALMPEMGSGPETGDPAAVAARFSGTALGPDGFTIPYETELLLQPSCAGPWCGGLAPTDDAVAFARDGGEGAYVIDLGPCGGNVFDTTPAVIETITQCMAGGACTPAN
ncbi:hypothetical protein [Flavimaricola marinus]|uniref:Uncharacterized protein n=1 Tax=Flavimaricola marinus TaxID=1819565 RepID=A0A238LGN1_9RHOB|nr:hypothetical protein [Flavimaricola marinus]SMY08116.1 hypothetical protein LOM8899_02265 [Flavimaricola marinus]